MKRNLFFLLIVSVAATSCQKHLSRDAAKKQIITAEKYPVTVDYDFTKGFIKDENTEGRGVTVIIGEEEFKEKQKMIEAFEKGKLVTFEEIPHREETTAWLLGTTVRTWTEVKISLTAEGKKYLLKEDDKSFKVKLWETSLDEITGIQEMRQQKIATVSYTVSNKDVTPFGESFSDKNKTSRKISYFSLYDDGWKINRLGVE